MASESYLDRPATIYGSAASSKYEKAWTSVAGWAAWCAGGELEAETAYGKQWTPGQDPQAVADEYRRRRAADRRWAGESDEDLLLAKEAETATDSWKRSNVPAFTPAGRFEGPREAPYQIHWTRLLSYEADKLKAEDAAGYRTAMAADPRVALASLSLSGGGVWFSVLIDRDPVSLAEYSRLWVIVERLLQARLDGLEPLLDAGFNDHADEHVKDATRLRFVSPDAEFHVNPEPKAIQVPADPRDVIRIQRRLAAGG